jgi:hypothetical protein
LSSTDVGKTANTPSIKAYIDRSFGYSETVLFENSLLTASTVPYTFQNINLSQAYTNFTHLIFESFSSKGIIIVTM